MKPQPLKISLQPEQSFSVRHDRVPAFYNKWHYHPEIELVYILKGSGQQFIGYDTRRFKPGDMILVGSNLPHMWQSDERNHPGHTPENSESYVIHFRPDCLGESFFGLPENKFIHSLLEKAQTGLAIQGKTRDKVAVLLGELLKANFTQRVILLLQLLQTLAAPSQDLKPICSSHYNNSFSQADSDRLNVIYQYIMANFYKPIKLEEIAKVANLAPHSFCRYFKLRTRKSFSRFLIEQRIGHACKLLAETQKTVAEISYECGYNSLSNFNKHFRLLIQKTPLDHRRFYEEKEEMLN